MAVLGHIWYGATGVDIDLSYTRRIPTYPNDAIYAIGLEPFAAVLVNPELTDAFTGLRFGYSGIGTKWVASSFRQNTGEIRFQTKGEPLVEFMYPDFVGNLLTGVFTHNLVSRLNTNSGGIGRLYWSDGTQYSLPLGVNEFLAFPGIAAPSGDGAGTPNRWAIATLYDDTRMRSLRLLNEPPEEAPYTNVEYRDGDGAVQILDATEATLDGFLGLGTGNNSYIHPYIYSILDLQPFGSDFFGEGATTVFVNKVDLEAGTITLERSLSARYKGQPDTTYTPLRAVYYPA